MVSAAASPAPSASSNGLDPLLRAVNREDAEEVKKLLASTTNVDVRDKYGYTPLHKACMRANKQLIGLLLDKGADLHAKCFEGSTPLFLATMCSPVVDVVETLLSRGAKIDALTNDGATMLHAAVSGGNMNMVKLFLENKQMDIHARRKDGATVLIDAVQHSGNKALIEYLISKGADVNAVDNLGANVMFKALFGGKVDLFDFLLLKGAKMKIPNSPPALHYAAMGGHKESVEWLFKKKVDINEKAKDGTNAVMHACKDSGNVEVLQLLHSKGGDLDAADGSGYTALHYAVEFDLVDSVEYLMANGAKANIAANDGATPLFSALLNADMTSTLAKRGANVKVTLKNGATLLHAAAEAGNLDVVKFYISQNLDLNAADMSGRTPLMYACEGQRCPLEVIKFLVSRGAKTEVFAKDGNTLLHLTALAERIDVVDLLVKTQGMDINVRRAKSGCTPLMTVAQKLGKMEVIKALTLKGADPKMFSADGSSLLQLAALGNQLELVKALVAEGHDLNYQRPDGATVLHAASFGGDAELVKYLLNENCNVEYLQAQGQRLRDGSTVLHCAAEAGNLEILRFFLKVGVPVGVKKQNGATPLFVAAQHCQAGGSTDAMQLLLDAGADPKAELKNGFTILHYAALGGAQGAFDFFLAKGDAGFRDVDVKSSTGTTPFHVAASRGHVKLMEYLIGKGAKKDATLRGGATALHCAAESGKAAAVEFLLAEKQKLDVNAKRSDGSTALHTAALRGDVATMKLLVKLGADAAAKSNDKSTALHFGAAAASRDVVKFLLEEKHVKSIDEAKDGGETVVHMVARAGDVEFLEFLVSRDIGANVRATREDGATALHVACEVPTATEMAQYLVKKGLEINTKRKDGATCLHGAAYVGNGDLVAFLISRGGDANIAMESGATPVHCAAGGGHKNVLEVFADKGFLDKGEVQKMLDEAAS